MRCRWPRPCHRRELAAGRVLGIDVEAFLLEKGRKNVVDAGLEQVIELRLVEAGPLPFDDESFDIVFSKDSLIHVEDKSGLYREVARVMRPGGRFTASDWLGGGDADELADYREWRSLTAHSFSMQTAEETTAELIGAGLDAVRTRDRTGWRDTFVALFDEESRAQTDPHLWAADTLTPAPSRLTSFVRTKYTRPDGGSPCAIRRPGSERP